MKKVRLSDHARGRLALRGTSEQEVREAVRRGVREPAKKGRRMCRLNFQYNQTWQGKHYAIKQVAPVIAEGADEIVVITVYTFYF